MNQNRLDGNKRNLKHYKLKITKISDKTIEALKNEMKWEGHGSELEPIVIEHLGYLPLILKLYRSSLYYEIKNLTLDKLICSNTQNITIENCTITHLKIEGCQNINLVNNIILKHKIVFTKRSTFTDNKIAQIENLKQNKNATINIPINRNTTNLLYCCLYFVAISILVSGTSYWYFGIIPFGIVFFFNYSTYVKNKRIEGKPDNIYVNNAEV